MDNDVRAYMKWCGLAILLIWLVIVIIVRCMPMLNRTSAFSQHRTHTKNFRNDNKQVLPVGRGGAILLLTDEQVQEQLLDNAMVMLYADWCIYCKVAKPEFLKAAMDSPIPFFAIHGPNAPKAVTTFSTGGYPTVVRLRPGACIEPYRGNRDAQSYAAFAQKP